MKKWLKWKKWKRWQKITIPIVAVVTLGGVSAGIYTATAGAPNWSSFSSAPAPAPAVKATPKKVSTPAKAKKPTKTAVRKAPRGKSMDAIPKRANKSSAARYGKTNKTTSKKIAASEKKKKKQKARPSKGRKRSQ